MVASATAVLVAAWNGYGWYDGVPIQVAPLAYVGGALAAIAIVWWLLDRRRGESHSAARLAQASVTLVVTPLLMAVIDGSPFRERAVVVAVDSRSGKQLWQSHLGFQYSISRVDLFQNVMTVVGGTLRGECGLQQVQVNLLRSTGKQHAATDLGARVPTKFIFGYFGYPNDSGVTSWQDPPLQERVSFPATSDYQVYSRDKLRRINMQTGDEMWSVRIPLLGSRSGIVATTEEAVYVVLAGRTRTTLYCD
jgi:hypothetical protein